MKTNDLLKNNGVLFRVLSINDEKVFAIDCEKQTMPKHYMKNFFNDAEIVDGLPFSIPDIDELTPIERNTAQQRFTMIAAALAVVGDEKKRNTMIDQSSHIYNISKQTLRSYLCSYLTYQSISALAPKKKKEKELTISQRNMRWALNKFFYTQNKNSLQTAYTMMLKEKYYDRNGALIPGYPSFNQFRYFYRKTRKLKNYYISRDGIKSYQRSKRPLLGDGVQDFAPCIGTAMLDSTICDVFLVDEAGRLIGRPVLVAACDANTSMCLGYSLLLEGGIYSLQNLMLNIIEDKVSLCERMGIKIKPEQWDTKELPRIMLTDGGSEYKGQTFSQIAELGVTLINLPPYRPDLKGSVEKLFDLIQNSYKDALKNKGAIMPDYQERGAHDYRKDAILTLLDFEKIVVRSIVYYNSARVIKKYPYSSEMLARKIKPYANNLWNYKKATEAEHLISVSSKDLILTLLPRTSGRFTRQGLKVNNLKYCANGYTEQFLSGGDAVVSYNPENCGKVWLKKDDGSFVEFKLIESRFSGMSFSEVEEFKKAQKELEDDAIQENYTAKLELISFIEATSQITKKEVKLKGIRSARSSVKTTMRKDIGGVING